MRNCICLSLNFPGSMCKTQLLKYFKYGYVFLVCPTNDEGIAVSRRKVYQISVVFLTDETCFQFYFSTWWAYSWCRLICQYTNKSNKVIILVSGSITDVWTICQIFRKLKQNLKTEKGLAPWTKGGPHYIWNWHPQVLGHEEKLCLILAFCNFYAYIKNFSWILMQQTKTEHLSYQNRLRGGIVQPGEEKAPGRLYCSLHST